MAYNRRYNPDALPAHAEPEEAAQMIGRTNSTNRDSGYSSRTESYTNRPPLNPSSSSSRNDDHGRPSGGSGSSSGRPDSTRHDRPPPGVGRTDSYSRRDDTRRDDRRDDPRRDDGRRESGRHRQGSYGSDQGRRYDSQQQGPPPSQSGYASRQQPPPPPATTPGTSRGGGPDEDQLRRMFRAVDRDRSGQLSEEELGAALVNGDYTLFDRHTVKMMIRMFDVDRSGTISFDEFCLWNFLGDWRKLFDRFDVDKSGTISLDEFSDALVAFGYRLSPDYIKILFNTYDIRGRGVLSFDLFVQSCISLRRMTEVFKKYDTDRDGYITLSFEEFLAEVLSQK